MRMGSALVIVHQIASPADIDIDRAEGHAAPAPDALNAVVIFVYVVLEFVHKPLAHSV